jgi:hypothetical protein
LKLLSKYLSLILFVAFLACSDDEGSPASVESINDLVPLKKGQYQIYDVFEVQFSEIGDPDTSRYELKMEVVDSFPNNSGSYTYVIHRSQRAEEAETWQFIDTWSVRLEGHQAIFNEGNTPFVKLVAPPEVGTTWNGNAYNNEGEDEYTIISSAESTEINGISFLEPVTVEQEFNDDPIVYTDLRSEVYVKGVGMVYKETTQLRYCVDESCNNQNVIIDGMVLKQSIKSYGVN